MTSVARGSARDRRGGAAGRDPASQAQQSAMPKDPDSPRTSSDSATAPRPPLFHYFAAEHGTPRSADLRVHTDVAKRRDTDAKEHEFGRSPPLVSPDLHGYRAHMAEGLPMRASSVRSLAASTRSLSPASVMSSPGMGPLSEITPLPSPLGSKCGSWIDLPAAAQGSPPTAAPGSPPRKRKAYGAIAPAAGADQAGGVLGAALSRARSQSNRSQSEHLPPPAVARPRNVTASGSHSGDAAKPMQREEYVAAQRGIAPAPAAARPPTPPRSNRSAADSSESESVSDSPRPRPVPMQYEATAVRSGAARRWTAVRQLGVGTFSTVMLATSDGGAPGRSEAALPPRTLVAVKICEHGPAGGADEKKIETSVKRELEILRAISHPSLVHLRAVRLAEKRAFLVLNYSAGGDLFELASLRLELLEPPLIRRIFAELVRAVAYLHAENIVHRDIKLENVLINPPLAALAGLDLATHPHPVVTLTDLGLGRYMPRPPEPPTLHTRCGSEDYAAPELLMGQGYDGRATDAWALGVLLYALLEGRLPFDPVPGARRQSPTPHRIARCEWQWVRWGDADGEWDGGEAAAAAAGKGADGCERFRLWGRQLEGAKVAVEALLKRASRRAPLAQVAEMEWVRDAIDVPAGLRREDWEEED